MVLFHQKLLGESVGPLLDKSSNGLKSPVTKVFQTIQEVQLDVTPGKIFGHGAMGGQKLKTSMRFTIRCYQVANDNRKSPQEKVSSV